MAEMASGVSEAIAEALQATRAEHLKEVDPAPTTTTTSVISESSTSIQMSGGSSSIFTAGGGASSSHNFDLPSAVPITCSTDCPRRDNGDATATTSASAAGAVSTTWVLPESTTVAAASFVSTPCESSTVPAVCVIDKPPWTAEPEATIPAFKRNSATAPLDSTSIPTVSSHLVPVTELAMLTRCSMEYLGDDTTVDTPAFTSCSSILKRLGSTTPPAGTVLEFDDAELVIAAQLPDDSLKHFSVSWFFSVPVRGTTATAAGIQVTSLFLSAEDVHTIVTPIAVSTVLFLLLYDVRPLPWPSFLDSHHVGDQILLMPCSLFTCSPGGTCQLCCPPGRATLSGKLQWEIAWVLQFEYDFRAEPDRLQIDCLQLCNCAVLQRLYSFSEQSRCCQPSGDDLDFRPDLSLQPDIFALSCCSIILHNMGTCYPLHRIECPWFLGSSIQPGTPLFLGTDSFWFQLSTAGYIEIHHGFLLYAWSLAVMIYFSDILIQLSRDVIRQLSHYFSQLQDLLIAIAKLQPRPTWEAYISGYKLQYSTQLGSIPWANQKKYITQDSIGNVAVPCFPLRTIVNASAYGSVLLQWYMAWSLTIAYSSVRKIHLARPAIRVMTTAVFASDYGLHLPMGGATIQCSDIFQWEIAWAFTLECFDWSFQLRQPISLAGVSELLDIISAGINTLQKPWDPGACSSFAQCQGNPEGLNDVCSNSPNAPFRMPWDPGGFSQDRLGGKPNFKKGGLSATLLMSDPSTWLGLDLGRCYWARPALEVINCYKYNMSWTWTGGLERNGGFGLEGRIGLGVALVIFFL